jgi:hypothetical protein
VLFFVKRAVVLLILLAFDLESIWSVFFHRLKKTFFKEMRYAVLTMSTAVIPRSSIKSARKSKNGIKLINFILLSTLALVSIDLAIRIVDVSL